MVRLRNIDFIYSDAEANMEISSSVTEYRSQVIEAIVLGIKDRPDIYAAWEGGSLATKSTDSFSDIDFSILAKAPIKPILDIVQNTLQKFQVIHTWQSNRSFWGEGMAQRVIVLKDSPKYFSVDCGIFDIDDRKLLADFMEVERHGSPKVFFDKLGLIKEGHTDVLALFEKQQLRAEELSQGFPIFKTLTLKEIERGKSIDAIGFFQAGLVRPYIEVLGMLRRPFKYDFGMRYIHQTFPLDEQKLIEEFCYVARFKDLPEKLAKLENEFNEAIKQIRSRKSL